MSEVAGWPLWRRDDPAGLLGYISADGIAPFLPGLPGRATGRSGDRLAKLRAVYDAFAAAGIVFADEPIASTGELQQIRAPYEVLAVPKRANCLDLSVTFAGACLDAGLHPLLVVCLPVGGGAAHSVVVVWLGGDWSGPGGDGRYQPPGPDDRPLVLSAPPLWPGGLRATAAEDEPGEFVAVDITRAATGPDGKTADFASAVVAATAIIASPTTLVPQSASAGTSDPAGSGGIPAAGAAWRWEFGLDAGLHFLPDRTIAPPGHPAVPPLDPPYQPPASAGSGPLAQVRARTETVPFVDRGELDLLLNWCTAADPQQAQGGGTTTGSTGPLAVTPPVRIAIVEGAGGSGKTRLAAEAAKRLGAQNWYTGFFPRTIPTGQPLEWLATVVSLVLVVVDYVEAADIPALVRAIRTLATRRSRTVLVFTARSRGDWWERLDRELTITGISRSVFFDLSLPDRPPETLRLFSKAYRRFTTATGAASRDEPKLPGRSARWTSLDLVMLAWLAAWTGPDLPRTPTDLYEAIISWELAHWADSIEEENQPRPAKTALRIAAACISLLSPSPSRLAELLDQAEKHKHTGIASRVIAQPLTGLLTQPGETELSLRPDPVADYLILSTFPGTGRELFDICVDFIDITDLGGLAAATPDSVPRAAGRQEAERFCDNLTRAGETITTVNAKPIASELATAAIDRKPGLWPEAFEVSLNRGGAFVPGLERLATRAGAGLPMARIDQRIPYGHSALRALALTAAQHSLPALSDLDVGPDQSARADALANLAVRLSEAGRQDEALAPAKQAADLYRQLAQANPGTYLADLASSLGNLGLRLSEIGRTDEALAPSQEAVDLYRRLAQSAPSTYLGELAMWLNNLAILLSRANRQGDAVAPSQEAVGLYRQLAEDAPGTYLGDLAAFLTNLASLLSELGRRDEALAPAQEGINLYRQLAETAPGIYMGNLATSLNNLGNRLSEVGRRDEALAPAQEAAGLYRQLADAAPSVYLGGLAMSLNTLAARLYETGQLDKALATAQEAVSSYRRLAESDPRAGVAGIAMSLNTLAALLYETGQLDEAHATAQEAVSSYRRLAAATPGAYLDSLATSLNNLGNILSAAGQRDNALSAAQEGADLYQQLARAMPEAYLGDLATSLTNLAALLSKAGRRDEALARAREAVTTRRQLAKASSAANLGGLALSLTNLATMLSGVGLPAEALAPAREATDLYRQLADAAPSVYLGGLAMSLTNLAAQLTEAGIHDEALARGQEATDLYQQLAQAIPGAHLGDLANSISNLAILLSTAGRQNEALAMARRAVDLYQQLADATPAAHLGGLAMSLTNLADQLSEAGKPDEALAPARESVRIRRQLGQAAPDVYLGDLAISLHSLGNRLSEAGRLDEAQAAAEEAVGLYRQLAEAAPGTHLGGLAGALNALASRLSEVGRPDESLVTAREAVDLYRQLAEAAPGTHLRGLAGALTSLAILLSDAGHQNEAFSIFADTAIDLDSGSAAMIQLACARWLAGSSSTADRRSMFAALAAAVMSASAEAHPQRGATARRAVRDALNGVDPHELAAFLSADDVMPAWATAELPDDLFTLLNGLMSSPSWAARAKLLRGPRAAILATQEAPAARTALAALYADNPPLLKLLAVLDASDEYGMDPVLEEMRAAEQHAQLLKSWIDTTTWTASQQYLGEHPDLLTNERTAATLAANSSEPILRRHLAIIRLAEGLSLDDVYDIVLDATDAASAAFAAIDSGDLERLVEIWHASEHLSELPFTGAYIATVIAVASGDPDNAQQYAQMAAEQTEQATRLAGARRLHELARHLPDRADVLAQLADLLTTAGGRSKNRNSAENPSRLATGPLLAKGLTQPASIEKGHENELTVTYEKVTEMRQLVATGTVGQIYLLEALCRFVRARSKIGAELDEAMAAAQEAAEIADTLADQLPEQASELSDRAVTALADVLEASGPRAEADLHAAVPHSGEDTADEEPLTSLAASIPDSFAHLTEKTRRMLPAVGLFHGVVDVGVLAGFSQVPWCPKRFAAPHTGDWTGVLDDATRVGLLTPVGAGMYRVHPALPHYLTVRWRAEDPDGYDEAQDDATSALTATYAVFGESLIEEIESGDAALAYQTIELQRDTLGTMLSYALDTQLWDEAVNILKPICRYWGARGMGGEAAAWADRIQAATQNPDGSPPPLDSPAGILWLFITGEQANQQRNAMRLEDAEHTSRRILDMLADQPTSPWQQANIAVACQQLGNIAQRRGRLDEAGDWHRKALAIREDLGNRPGIASNYNDLGLTARGRGRLDEARESYRKALAISEDLQDRPGMATAYHNLGTLAADKEQLDEAEDWYRKALAIHEDLQDRPRMAASYGQLGLLAEERRQPHQALKWMIRCISVFDEFPHQATEPGPKHLARLTSVLGMTVLEDCWQEITGGPLPSAVRDYANAYQTAVTKERNDDR